MKKNLIIPIQIQVRFHFDPNYVCAQLFFDRFCYGTRGTVLFPWLDFGHSIQK